MEDNSKKKFVTLLSEDDLECCAINAPIRLLEGKSNSEAAKEATFISTKAWSDFYRSSATISFDFFKPISKI